MILAQNLIKLCKSKGLTIAALAKESGVKQPTLHGWSTGRAVHNIDDLKKVCNVLEVSLHCILYGEIDPWEGHCSLCDKGP
jgi:transcriptional regulator with XRE-family HTH domain